MDSIDIQSKASDIHSRYLHDLSEDLMMKISGFLDLKYSCWLKLNRSLRNLIVIKVFPNITKVEQQQIKSKNALYSLLPQLSRLQILDLTSSTWLEDSHLEEIASRCPGLLALNLSRCERITDAGIIAIAAKCLSIHSVDLSFCSRTSYESALALYDARNQDVVVILQCHLHCVLFRVS
jgi:hypothetical protein